MVAAGALLALGIKELIDHWDLIKAKMQQFWEFVEPFAIALAVVLLAPYLPLIAIIVLVIRNFSDLKQAAIDIFGAIETTINEKLGFIKDIISFAFEFYKTIFLTQLQIIWAYVSFIFEEVKIVVDTAMKVLSDLFDVGLAVLKGDWQGAWDAIKQMFGDFWWGIWAMLGGALNYLGTLGTLILGAIGDLSRLLWDVGKDIIGGLWDGMKDKWNDVKDWVGGLGGAIAGLKGPLDVDRVLLQPAGRAIMGGLQGGLQEGWSPISTMLPMMTAAIPAAVGASMSTQKGGRGDIHISIGRVDARSEDEARQAASSLGYGLQQAMRARGVA